MKNEPSSHVVTADAQYSISYKIVPPSDFVTRYTGQPAATQPIYFFEGATTRERDDLAGKPGYDPNLVKGLDIPFGARCVIGVPSLTYQDAGVTKEYAWVPIWRQRTIAEFTTERKPYQQFEVLGVPDTTAVTGGSRVYVPAYYMGQPYLQGEPAIPGRCKQVIHALDYQAAFPQTLLGPRIPALSGGGFVEGVIQQGVQDPVAFAGIATRPKFIYFEIPCLGNDLLLGLYRPDTVSNWTFGVGTTDAVMAQFFANPNVSVTVNTGVSP